MSATLKDRERVTIDQDRRLRRMRLLRQNRPTHHPHRSWHTNDRDMRRALGNVPCGKRAAALERGNDVLLPHDTHATYDLPPPDQESESVWRRWRPNGRLETRSKFVRRHEAHLKPEIPKCRENSKNRYVTNICRIGSRKFRDLRDRGRKLWLFPQIKTNYFE